MTGFMNEGKAVNGIYLDFTKAFDTVFCNILVCELGYYGLDGWTTRRIKTG